MQVIKLVIIILFVALFLYFLGNPFFNNIINLRSHFESAKNYSKEQIEKYNNKK